jgi:hypothetical protein
LKLHSVPKNLGNYTHRTRKSANFIEAWYG